MVTFDTIIAVPTDSASGGGGFSTFDISFADLVTEKVFVADRPAAVIKR
jgi:hypothetical protein